MDIRYILAFMVCLVTISEGDVRFQQKALDEILQHGNELASRIMPKGHEKELLKNSMATGSEHDMDGPVCASCKTLIGVLKGVASVREWEEVRDLVVDLCYYLFENVTNDAYVNTDVLCPGIIDIQGPHVYEIMQPKYRKTPEDICRNLNACFPPPKEESELKTKKTNHVPKPQKPRTNRKLSLAERKMAALTVVQMSDIHIEPLYAEGSSTDCGLSVCCIERYGPGDAGPWGGYLCNIPPKTMELFFHKAVEFNPAFVVFSGDTPPHRMWDETYSSQLNCTDLLIESATRIMGDYTVYPNIGNHEMYPTNLFSIEYLKPYTQDMANAFAESWTDLAGFGLEQQETMRTGGYYTTLALPGLRLLSYNSNYLYGFNWYNTLMEGRDEVENMKAFVRDTLEYSRQNGEQVLIVGHHPLGGGDSIILQSRDFEIIIANYSDIIVAQISGHTHYDHYKVLSDNGTALTMTYINPAVTSNSHVNPSMRVFYIDSETYEVIDYEQYGFNLLDASESADPPVIELWYSAVTEYGLTDMSPASWQDLTNRLQTDDVLFEQYYYNYANRYNESAICDAACRTNTLCSNQFYNFDEAFYCAE